MANSNRRHVDRKDAGSRALTSVGTVRDVTEDKPAEEALRESEERFRSVLEVSRDLIYRLDLHPENESRSNVTLQRENRGHWAEERGHLTVSAPYSNRPGNPHTGLRASNARPQWGDFEMTTFGGTQRL